MSVIEYTKHDIKNMYIKLFLSSDLDLVKESTSRYYKILDQHKSSKLLEPSLREQISKVLKKFNK